MPEQGRWELVYFWGLQQSQASLLSQCHASERHYSSENKSIWHLNLFSAFAHMHSYIHVYLHIHIQAQKIITLTRSENIITKLLIF